MMAVREQNKRISEETVSIKFQRQKPAWSAIKLLLGEFQE